MALVVGTNSYVSVAEADAYFVERFGSDQWASLAEESKEAALISAAQLLDLYCTWTGDKTDPEQPLSFPRDGDTEVPQTIKNAQCEIAYSVVSAGSIVPEQEAALTSLSAGDVRLQWVANYATTNTIYNSYVNALLTPYCDPNATDNSGSTAGVIRT